MIRIINQEEFKKCCEMCNSKDIESRLLGLSLLEECTEFLLNTCNVSVLVKHFYGGECKYSWHTFVKIGIKAPEFEFGTVLYNLLYNRFYKLKTITYKLIENDQSN
jgi:hypothetical protein